MAAEKSLSGERRASKNSDGGGQQNKSPAVRQKMLKIKP